MNLVIITRIKNVSVHQHSLKSEILELKELPTTYHSLVPESLTTSQICSVIQIVGVGLINSCVPQLEKQLNNQIFVGESKGQCMLETQQFLQSVYLLCLKANVFIALLNCHNQICGKNPGIIKCGYIC